MQNIKWKTAISGFAHSSPIIWNNKLFVTTAVSSRANATFKHGLYGSGTASDDRSQHAWQVWCLDKTSGKVIWRRTAAEGIPQDKRHIKASYANSTPVTDGRYVVALFGSQGAFAYDFTGKLIWQKNLGRLNMGAYDAPDYEWGSGSSPIIYENLVIFQCDTQDESFLLACDLENGETVWKTSREELPSWGTPTIYPGQDRVELITNGSNFIRGYDPMTGAELWRLGGSSKITAPTPVFSADLIIVASGRRPEKPIYAIRPGAVGDITLAHKQFSNEFVAWFVRGRGPYMPTPLIYQDYLYVLGNSGILDCYELRTGQEVYRQRLSHTGGGFSASPVAADGLIYLTSEDGEIFVVKAGPTYELVARNDLGERIMATPAISENLLYVRAENHLLAIGTVK
ncbi:MAG: PQQ-binding-like beta-propeller repeat protein [bacterium]